MPSSRGSSQPRDRTCVSYVSCIGRRVLYHCAIWEAPRGAGGPTEGEFKAVSQKDREHGTQRPVVMVEWACKHLAAEALGAPLSLPSASRLRTLPLPLGGNEDTA